jgi:hypothetical protein
MGQAHGHCDWWLVVVQKHHHGRMRSREKGTAGITYVRTKVPKFEKEDDFWGHRWVMENNPEVI